MNQLLVTYQRDSQGRTLGRAMTTYTALNESASRMLGRRAASLDPPYDKETPPLHQQLAEHAASVDGTAAIANVLLMKPNLPPFSGFRRSWKRRIANHFHFQIGGVSVTYCYIRKNGCSAFKRLMLDMAAYTGPWDNALDFMKQRYSATSVEDAADADWRIYVYRDPFSRAASLFRNKVIMQSGAADLLSDFQKLTGRDPAEITFSTFVEDYLARGAKDPHTWPQINHLLPIDYNAACTLDSLGARITEMLGEDVASRYFVRPANASSDMLYDESVSKVLVAELRQRYSSSRELPSDRALATEELRDIIYRRYQNDYALDPERPQVRVQKVA